MYINVFVFHVCYCTPQAKQWVRDFLQLGTQLQGYQKKHVTPYMHVLVYHIPGMLRRFGNIKQFSGQGVEKNNDDCKRNYFSSNRHDAATEIIKADVRLQTLDQGTAGLPSCRRVKRPYRKADTEYWEEGGIQQLRASKRQHPTP